MAPRGIVAASVAALFTPRLEEAGIDADVLAPATFLVIVLTVTLYGLTARPMARRLRVAEPEPRAVALVGAPPWAIALAAELARADVTVLVVTSDADEAAAASRRLLLVYDGPLTPDGLAEAAHALGVHQVLAVSGRDELNDLGTDRLAEVVGRPNLFLVRSRKAPPTSFRGATRTVEARRAFDDDLHREDLARRFEEGWSFTTVDADSTDADDLPLVHVVAQGSPTVLTARTRERARGGRLLVMRPPPRVDGPGRRRR